MLCPLLFCVIGAIATTQETGRNLAIGAVSAAVTSVLTMIIGLCGFRVLLVYALKQISTF